MFLIYSRNILSVILHSYHVEKPRSTVEVVLVFLILRLFSKYRKGSFTGLAQFRKSFTSLL